MNRHTHTHTSYLGTIVVFSKTPRRQISRAGRHADTASIKFSEGEVTEVIEMRHETHPNGCVAAEKDGEQRKWFSEFERFSTYIKRN